MPLTHTENDDTKHKEKLDRSSVIHFLSFYLNNLYFKKNEKEKKGEDLALRPKNWKHSPHTPIYTWRV